MDPKRTPTASEPSPEPPPPPPDPDPPPAPAKRTWHTPTLRIIGTVKDLTLTGAIGTAEGIGRKLGT